MVRHMVMFKIKEQPTKEAKQKIVEEIKQKLEALSIKIPVIRFINVGINTNDSPNGFDLILESEFDTPEDLEAYRVHPEHQAVVAYLKEHSEQAASVDYEI